MKQQRRFSASVSTDKHGLVVIGGESNSKTRSTSIETLKDKEWTELGQSDSLEISRHCAATVNQGNDIFLIGGHYKEQRFSDQVIKLVLNKNNKIEIINVKGTKMKHGREFHNCAFVDKENIIVVGGRNHSGTLNSVEVFNARTLRWTAPSQCQLNFSISHAQLISVQDQKGKLAVLLK